MAQNCSHCGSGDTSTGTASFRCLTCGADTFYDETKNKPRKR